MDLQETILALQALVDAGYTSLPLVSDVSGEEMGLQIPSPEDLSEGEQEAEIAAYWVR